MRLLIDTCTLIWFAEGSRRLSPRAKIFIEDEANEIVVSAISALEIAIKVRNGQAPSAVFLNAEFSEILEEAGFQSLPMTVEHASLAGSMTAEHRDPFDRIIAAQSLSENLPLISSDNDFDKFNVARLW